MSKNDDDDEREFSVVLVIAGDPPAKGAGRPNAYWQKVREDQDDEETVTERKAADNFGGGYRGVRPAPHGGAATVRSDDTIGAEDLCWCGQPQGHDWPGKSSGRKHPREERGMATATDRRLDRRDLRAYHQRLQDFVMKCVNGDGIRFRIAKNSVILYPPDGSQPVTVFARSGDRQVRQLQKWYVEHVHQEPEAEGPVDEEALSRLSEAVNNPVEHPTPQKKEPAVTTEVQQQPAQEDRPSTPVIRERARAANAKKGNWRPYVTEKGGEHPLVITDGETLKCSSELCVGTDHEYLKSNMSIGGHMRIYHSETVKDFYSEETIAKRVESNKHGRLVGEVIKAMEILGEAVQVPVGSNVDAERVKELEAENAELKARIDEFEVKQSLMREALGL